jgi:XTP/dITP diphosphohydrolase
VARLLLATTNPGKLREFRRLLADQPFELVSPDDVGLALAVEEDGETYEANAVKKARAYAEASGLLALADDSGIEVDALGGQPGVRSARYGGPGLNDAGRRDLLVAALAGVAVAERGARYRAVIAVAAPGGEVRCFAGTMEGRIGDEARGERGFGYDPVFVTCDGRTAAELSDEEKDAVSHRGKALRLAAAYLRELAT